MPTYRVEEASSARAGCKGPKPCGKEHKIPKGGLRFGSLVTIGGHDSWAWRHWGCCTPKVITNLKEAIENDTENLDGFEDLSPENQQKIRTALDNEHVDDADIPDSARKPPGEEGEGEDGQDADSPKKKRSPAKKGGKKAAAAAAADKEGDDAQEEKPKRKRAPPKKKAKAEEIDDEEEVDDEEFHEEPEEKPKSRRGRKGAAKKEESDEDEEEEEVMPKPKQRKRVKDDSE